MTYRTREQQIEVTRARQAKDISDLQELLYFLESKDPLNHNYTTLLSIGTGMKANNTVMLIKQRM